MFSATARMLYIYSLTDTVLENPTDYIKPELAFKKAYLRIYDYFLGYIYIYIMRWVYCRHIKLLISRMHAICFKFCLLYSKLKSVGHDLWGKQHHYAIYSCRNSETACCTAWYSRRKLHYVYFIVFRCQCEDRFIFIQGKTKHPVDIIIFRAVISHSDIMAPFIFLIGFRLNAEVYIK